MIYALLDEAGKVIAQVVSNTHPLETRTVPGPDGEPIEIGPAYNWRVDRVIEIESKHDLEAEEFIDGAWRTKPEVIEARLCTAIDSERASRGDVALTAGESVKLAYSRKGAEAREYIGRSQPPPTDPALLNALYPWLMAEVEVSGDPLGTVAERVMAGMQASEAMVRHIEAVATTAKRQIREAATAEEKRAIYAGIQWEPDNGGDAS